MTTSNFLLPDAVVVLRQTPGVFRALLSELPDRWITADEGTGTFSPFDNLGHLIHGERTDWIPRARIILEQGPDRTFEPYDRFAQNRESVGKTLDTLLDEFESLRGENVATLLGFSLTERELDLHGTHPELGPVSLRQLLAAWVTHDLGHIAQVARVMARQYRHAVGPWRAYLPVIDRGPPIEEDAG